MHTATEFTWVAQEFNQYQALVAAESCDHWIADLGATIHIAYDHAVFITYKSTPGHTIQGVGSMPVMGRGNVKILLSVNGKTSEMTLTDVIHAPQMEFNLLSIPRIANGPFDVHFGTRLTICQRKIGETKTEVVATGERRGNLYFLHAQTIKAHQVNAAIIKKSWNEWHHLLGHISQDYIDCLVKYNMATGINLDSETTASQCEACI